MSDAPLSASDLGLTEEQMKQLRERLQGQPVDTLKTSQAQAVSLAKEIEKSKVEVAKAVQQEKTVVFPF